MKPVIPSSLPDVKLPSEVARLPNEFSVEFFHIYTDEVINGRHIQGLKYLQAVEKTWTFPYTRIILIDNYNPTKQITTAEKVLAYLASQGMLPHYWAYEKDVIPNAKLLLSSITHRKLKRSYESYISKNQKYPCSLLTASWYLMRLGRLENSNVIHSTGNGVYSPASRLLNLLPQDYREIERRARQIILHSDFKAEADKIQDLFYPIDSGRALDLF